MVRALEMVAPGTALREGIDNILARAHRRADRDRRRGRAGVPVLRRDQARASITRRRCSTSSRRWTARSSLSSNATKIVHVNVQLTPDPTILTHETGTRHRTAERVSKQTDALVVAVSERREVVSLYVDGVKYILEDIPVVLAKANQALATLDKYRSRLDQVSTRLTALEFEGGATLHDVLTVLQRAELVTRMAVGDRALHRRARDRGAADRDAARRDDGRRRRRQGGAGARLSASRTPTRASRRRSTSWSAFRIRTCSTSVASPSCSATTAS